MPPGLPEPKLYDLDGREQTLPRWAGDYQMNYQTLLKRLRCGMGLQEALTAPKRRQPRYFTLRGTTLTLAAWARLKGIPRGTLKKRLDRGWLLQRALQTPSKDRPAPGRRTQPDLTGRRFGDILVLRPATVGKHKARRYHCQCACGNKWIVPGSRLLAGQKGCRSSAECLTKMGKRQWRKRDSTVKGARIAGVEIEYRAWLHLRAKAKRKKAVVDSRWFADFWEFLEDVGEKPDPGCVFARRDWGGSFDIENACWMTQSEARQNYHRT